MKYADCKRQLWHVNSVIKRLEAKSSTAMTEQLKKDAKALLETWRNDIQRQLDNLDALSNVEQAPSTLSLTMQAMLALENKAQTKPIVAKPVEVAMLDDKSVLGVLNNQHMAYVYIKVRDPSLPSHIIRLYYIERGVIYSGGIVYKEHLQTPTDTQIHHAKLLAKPVAEVYVETNTPVAPTTAPAARKFMGQRVNTEQSIGRAKRGSDAS